MQTFQEAWAPISFKAYIPVLITVRACGGEIKSDDNNKNNTVKVETKSKLIPKQILS